MSLSFKPPSFMPPFLRIFAFAAVLAVSGVPAHASDNQSTGGPPGTNPSKVCHGATTEQQAFSNQTLKMIQALTTGATGKPDEDFIRIMLPSYQAVSDLAETELEYGKDPAMRELARHILKAHKDELDAMDKWRVAHNIAEPVEPDLASHEDPPKIIPSTLNSPIQYAIMPFSPAAKIAPLPANVTMPAHAAVSQPPAPPGGSPEDVLKTLPTPTAPPQTPTK